MLVDFLLLFDTVDSGVGHCPQDEAPDVVNPLIERFVLRHSAD